jgi:hypothetical protein
MVAGAPAVHAYSTPPGAWIDAGGPSGGTILAYGSGGGALFAGTGAGLFRSLDAGLTWSNVLRTAPAHSPFVEVAGDGDTVLAATFSGRLFRSTDGGGTWAEILSPSSGFPIRRILFDGPRVWMVVLDLPTEGGGTLLVSEDDGDSWAPLFTPRAVTDVHVTDSGIFLLGIEFGFIGLAMRSTDGGNSWDVLGGFEGQNGLPSFSSYASLASSGASLFLGTGDGLFKSTDNGENWTQPPFPLPGDYTTGAQLVLAHHGAVYFVGARRDGGQDDVGAGVWKSTDGGETFVHADDGGPGHLIPFANDIIAVGDSILLGGGHFGGYRTDNDGGLWSPSMDGIVNTTVFALGGDESRVYANVVNLDEVWRQSPGEAEWTETSLNVPGGRDPIMDIWARGNGVVFAGTLTAGIYRSDNGGETWNPVNTGVPTYNGTAGLQFREVEAFAEKDGFLFAATGRGLQQVPGQQAFFTTGGGFIRSSNGGNSWTRINAGFPVIANDAFGAPLFDPVLTLAATDSAVVAGTWRRGAFRSSNNGGSWQAANSGIPVGTSGLLPVVGGMIHVDGVLYAGIGATAGARGVIKSADHGQSWTFHNAGLPDRDVRDLEYYNGVLYAAVGAWLGQAASEDGVYASTDAGLTWARVSGAVDGIAVFELAVGGNALYAGTNGFGAFRLAISGACRTANECTPAGSEEACQALGYVCDVAAIAGPQFTGCYGDVDGNGFVNAADRGFIAANIGSTEPDAVCLHDMDGNGFINAADRGFVSAAIGLCVPLPDYQNGSGLHGGAPDPRFPPPVFEPGGTCE